METELYQPEDRAQPGSLIELFFDPVEDFGELVPVGEKDLSAEYRSLLAHHDHMTVTQEAWHNSLVDLHALNERADEDFYARESLLQRQRDGAVVQYGIMRIALVGLPEIVRLEILSRALPLGRVLIRHHLLRVVELHQLWRVNAGERLRSLLRLSGDQPAYARSAGILVDGKPAVELLEVATL
ncbi:MAG: hypothetical protein AAGA92_12390 [Planctomycetota bacterium]